MESKHILNISCNVGEALQAALKHRDEYTQNHCERVSSLARRLGLHFKFDDNALEQLEIAAMFHDIGKIGIPDTILLHPGKLSDTEFEQMKMHAEIGANIVEKLNIVDADKIAEIILHHHEHFDGSGYPHGLAGNEIPLSSRIITVIDVFDALSSQRRYRNAVSTIETLSTMSEQMAYKFDPNVLEAFKAVVVSIESSHEFSS